MISRTLCGEGTSLALVGHHSSDGVTIKIRYGVDVLLHQPVLHPISSYWVGWLSQTWPVIWSIDRNRRFLVALPADSKETKLGSRNQEASSSAGKNTSVVLVPCHTWNHDPAAIFCGVDISEVPRCHLLQQMKSQWVSQKITSRIGVSWTHSILFCFNLFELNELWPYY